MRLGNYTFNSRYPLIVAGLALMLMAACTPTTPSEQSAGVPTDTLAPLVTLTPRFTATARAVPNAVINDYPAESTRQIRLFHLLRSTTPTASDTGSNRDYCVT